MSRTIITLIALALSYGALGLYSFKEHEQLIAAQGRQAVAEANLKLCQQAAKDQNSAVISMQLQANEAKQRAQAALAKANASARAQAREHAQLQKLISEPSQQKSCDAAWDEIEQLQ